MDANDDELRRKRLRPAPTDDFVCQSLQTYWNIKVRLCNILFVITHSKNKSD